MCQLRVWRVQLDQVPESLWPFGTFDEFMPRTSVPTTLEFLMSQTPSPYSEPVQTAPPQAGVSRNTVAIVAIVAVTILLMCGGMIGLGIYAVDRFADSMSDFADDQWYEEDAATALEFAIEQDTEVGDRVGEIEQIQHEGDLTYDDKAGAEDFYYRVEGSSGEALVVVQFDDSDQRWFQSVELVDGDGVESPRQTLRARNPPFDSQWSRRVYDILAANDHSLAQSLEIGAIRWISYEYERSSERSSGQELLFEIHGESGAVSVLARFENMKYDSVDSIQMVDDEGAPQRAIYTANAAPEIAIAE